MVREVFFCGVVGSSMVIVELDGLGYILTWFDLVIASSIPTLHSVSTSSWLLQPVALSWIMMVSLGFAR